MRTMLPLLAILACTLAVAEEYTAPPFTPTPVMQWGKPLPGGPIRALFILQGAKQEALEFMRRFDVQGEVLVSAAGGKYGLGSTESSLARRILETEPVQVTVIGGIFWKRLPATVRLAILEKVQQGMGLVYVDAPNSAMDTTLPKVMAADPAPEAATAVCNGIPIPLLPLVTIDPERNAYTIYPDAQHPAPTPEQLVTGARFGKGRLCLLHYSVAQSNVVYLYSLTPGLKMQDMPFTRDYLYWEYCHALLGKAVRWAGGRDPEVTLKVAANPTGLQVGTVSVEATRDGGPVEVEATVRDRYWIKRGQVSQTLQPAPGKPAQLTVSLKGQQLPESGVYFIDVQARREGKVLDWATGATEMPATAKLSVQLDRPRYAPDQTINATVQVEGAKPGAQVTVLLTGTDDRLLGMKTLPAKPTLQAQFSMQGAQTLVSYCWAILSQEGQVPCRERVPVFLKPGTPQQFFAYSWMQGETYYQRDYLRRIQDQGVDSVTAGGGAATYFCEGSRLAAELNMRCVPTNVVDSRANCEPGTENLLRPMTDPKIIAEEDQRIRDNVPRTAVLDPIGYSLMDEWVLGTPQTRADYGPSAVAAFRQWLPTKYADIAALNAEWGTNFAGFDAVTPVKVEEIRKTQPEKSEVAKVNLAPFVDYRLFLDRVGPTAFHHFAETIRTLDPGAKVGLCGTESASTWFGHEWWALSQSLDFICGYGDASAIPNIANFRGLQREFQRSFRTPGSLLACWVGYGESDFYRDQGLKLLLHDFQGIAYFSGEPMAYQDFPYLDYDYTLSRRALLAGACTRELRQGLDQLFWHSQRENCGIAILLSQSSLHVASAVGQEGVWGDRMVQLTRGIEDAGYQYDFVAPAQVAAGGLKGYEVLLLPGATALSDAEVKAVQAFAAGGGQVLSDVPPGMMDEHGKGRATAPEIGGKTVALAPERPGNAETMRGLLAGCGLAPLVAVEQADKANLPIETIRYRNGAAEFYSLQTDVLEWKQPKPQATITFPHEGYLYDVREGKALGRGNKAQAILDPMHILLYALLPYEVRGVQVTAGAARVGQPLTVKLTVQAEGAKAGTHYLRVTALGADGKERPGFARTVQAKQGAGETKLWLALNDAPGKWTVQARDAATGVTGSAVVEVRP